MEEDWDIIGFSVLDETIVNDILNMDEAHRLRPHVLILAGGIEAQFNYQTLLDKSACRIVVLGEGEVPLLRLAEGDPWQNIPGIVLKNMAVAMDEELFNEATQTIPWETINYEDYWDVYTEMYGDQWNDDIADQVKTVRIFSRNRCPIGCKYCSSTFQLTLATGGRVPVIGTTDDNLISVIQRVVDSHPETRMIYFTDDDFCINKVKVIEFCKKAIEHNFGDLIFMCFARITDLTEDVIRWMSRANFRKLNIGVESFSQQVLDEVGKRCDVDRVHVVLKLLKENGIRPHFNILLTTPQSRLDDVETTVDHTMSYISDSFYMAGIIAGIEPLKGAEMAEMYCEFKSEVIQIPGTDHYLQRDGVIYGVDPQVREFQIRYAEGLDAEMDEFARENEIRHPFSNNTALGKLLFSKRLIAEIRRDHGVPQATQGEHSNSPVFTGPGDSTRHMLA